MSRVSLVAVIAAISILIPPAAAWAQSASRPSAGSNSAGIARSIGSGVNSSVNTEPGVTTGSVGRLGTGTAATPQTDSDAAINEENKTIDRRLKSICRGC